MAIKYIMTKNNEIVIFSGLLNHSEVASKFGGATSAGFINFNEGVNCYGESISLGISSKKEDSEIAERQLFEY